MHAMLPTCGRACYSTALRFALSRRRPYSHSSSSLVTSPPRFEHFTVPCRSNGFVTIDVFHSSKPASPILIYLPSGPVVPERAEEEERVISTLSVSTGATVARINYRASSIHQFPTPVHDVLRGYDWVKDNLLQDGFSRPVIARMGVCGELMGGSLATMLALTECRSGASRIGVAAVNNPIADWVFPDDLPFKPAAELVEPLRPEETAIPADEDPMSPASTQASAVVENSSDDEDLHVPMGQVGVPAEKSSKRSPKKPPPTSWQLYGDNAIIPTVTLSGERDMLLRRPQDCFDRFVSPIHFFRSPHGILLLPGGDNTPAPEPPHDLLDVATQLDINHFQSVEAASNTLDLPTLARCRAYARVYPPAGLNLSLPSWHITTGLQSPLLDQGKELIKMIKRSIARQALKSRAGRSRWHDTLEKENYEAYANSRVHVVLKGEIGLWTQQDDKDEWKMHVQGVGAFLKENLDPRFA